MLDASAMVVLLVGRDASRAVAARECARVLVDGGVVVVLEDVVDARDPAEANYRRAMELLRAVDATRGPVADVDDLSAALREQLGEAIVRGESENEETLVDPLAPVHWMRARIDAGERGLARDLDVLAAEIARHGMRIGRYAHRVFARRPVPGVRA